MDIYLVKLLKIEKNISILDSSNLSVRRVIVPVAWINLSANQSVHSVALGIVVFTVTAGAEHGHDVNHDVHS